MSQSQPDYYSTLGLTPTATQEEVKKRYRELARRYHPDVNPSAEATQKIKVINEAYHILGDSDRRASYDSERQLRARAATQNPPRPNAPSERTTERRPAPPRSPFTAERADFNGFGRTRRDRTPPRPAAEPKAERRPPQERPAADRRSSGPFGSTDRLVSEAQLAFINRRYRESEDLCHQVIQIDHRNATAHELLGDICLKRGQVESAIAAYSYAIQFNPRNIGVQAKLDRLMGGRVGSAGPTVTRKTPASGWQGLKDGPNREINLAVVNLLTFLLLLGTMAVYKLGQGAVPLVPLLMLALAGVLAGILLALNGNMRPLAEELLEREERQQQTRTPITLGAILTLFAIIWFYASLLVFLGIGLSRNRLSVSVLRVYGATLVLIALAAMLTTPHGQTWGYESILIALFSGNVLFPTLLVGWATGDSIRLRR